MKILFAMLIAGALVFFSAVCLWAFDAFSFREAVKTSIMLTGFGVVVFELLSVLFFAVVIVGVWFSCSPIGRLYAAGVAVFCFIMLTLKLSETIPQNLQLFGFGVKHLISISMLIPVFVYIGFAVWFIVIGRYKHYGY